MPQCASVKKKGSTDQCKAPSLVGMNLCGRHVKMKIITMWASVNAEKSDSASKIQSLWKGWKIRRYLNLCGPGVLKREQCCNDEDLVSCESKDRQYPLDYFGIKEGDKIWWFDFCTVWDWCGRSVEPTNPYTKVAISAEDKARLRKVHMLRRRSKMMIPEESRVFGERMARRWNVLCQAFRYYGFEDAHPEHFSNIQRLNMMAMFHMFRDDLLAVPNHPIRIVQLCELILSKTDIPTYNFMLVSTTILHLVLMETRSYDTVFLLMGALYRC